MSSNLKIFMKVFYESNQGFRDHFVSNRKEVISNSW